MNPISAEYLKKFNCYFWEIFNELRAGHLQLSRGDETAFLAFIDHLDLPHKLTYASKKIFIENRRNQLLQKIKLGNLPEGEYHFDGSEKNNQNNEFNSFANESQLYAHVKKSFTYNFAKKRKRYLYFNLRRH
ncbi:MAG: hypothetical protein LBI69_02935 [Puniceicoccales bacterium]|jgi:hypothetical protein|nr:hypothetical protein [Puniceicoccales bacterium]